MGRPEKTRTIGCVAQGRGFKPVGRPATELEIETLRADELEALRLADLEGLYQEAAAERMGISRPTFARILDRARSIVARALVEEKLLLIGEGPVVDGPITAVAVPGARRRQKTRSRLPLRPCSPSRKETGKMMIAVPIREGRFTQPLRRRRGLCTLHSGRVSERSLNNARPPLPSTAAACSRCGSENRE